MNRVTELNNGKNIITVVIERKENDFQPF